MAFYSKRGGDNYRNEEIQDLFLLEKGEGLENSKLGNRYHNVEIRI
jgi:hypothetical protein